MNPKLSFLVACIVSTSAVNAQPTVSGNSSISGHAQQWEFSVTPYLWALGINGSISHDGTTLGNVNLSPGSVLSDLKMAGMVVGEARLGRVGLYIDAMYGDLGQTNSRVVDQVNLSAKTSVKLGLLTVAPSYTLTESAAWRVDGLVGVRVMWQDASSTITATQFNQSITKSSSINVTDAVAGLKGRVKLGQSDYFVPFYVDVGTGDKSSFTSQAYAGIGKTFSWGDLSLVAKNVYYQFKPNNLTTDLNLFGLAVGATFRF
ncbi:MAG: hypothetical protein LRY53_07460 [Burkholderiaceae bacterium]|nr:hypothetical protein [Burkholderiaceae bacterium]MCD8537026.1 hypothetical protein [Burkholderiaceae bacterium]MCD8565465.1 hypothetical protein [Burkholderiaceae bacterium]